MEDKTFERIEAYLSGELSQEAKTAFEANIQADPSLAEEVALQRDTHQLLALGNQLTYKDKLKAIDSEMRANATVRPLFGNARMWLAAAAVLIAVSVLLWNLSIPGGNSYMNEFSAYPDLTSMRNDTLDDLKTGMIAYSNEKYDIAESYLSKYLNENPDQGFVHFYLGNTYMALNQASKAVDEFRQVESPKWKQPADWYLALALGASEQKEEAQQLLKRIASDNDHAYKEQAEELLK
ncbi:MAG: hypothetical protein MRZ79_12250 [Bacteroidia bacterium]|nr:hypothetical protein [Bacteroidia bacterium]